MFHSSFIAMVLLLNTAEAADTWTSIATGVDLLNRVETRADPQDTQTWRVLR